MRRDDGKSRNDERCRIVEKTAWSCVFIQRLLAKEFHTHIPAVSEEPYGKKSWERYGVKPRNEEDCIYITGIKDRYREDPALKRNGSTKIPSKI